MLLSSFGAKFWKTWCGLCEVLIGRWGRLGANFTNTLLICGFSGRIMWLSLSCRLVLPFLFVLGSDGCILEEQQRFCFVGRCLVAAITDIRTAILLFCDGYRCIDCRARHCHYLAKQVFRSQFSKFSEKSG